MRPVQHGPDSFKVGILTFHFTTNYGAVLQAYCFSKLLRELKLDNEIIDYRPARAILVYAGVLLMSKEFLANLTKALRFWTFLHKRLALSANASPSRPRLRGKAFSGSYDLVFVGSDEVWNVESFRGYDSSFFLDFLPAATARSSFAASCGQTRTFGVHRTEIRAMMDNFVSISVRDDNSRKLIRRELAKDSCKILDPSLLVSAADDFGTKSRFTSQNYFLVYGKLKPSELDFVKASSSSREAIVVSVGERNRGSDYNVVDGGPEEWLSLIRGAKEIFTTYFHGVAFGLQTRGQVHVFGRPEKSAKIQQLTEDLQLCVKTPALPELKKDDLDLSVLALSSNSQKLIDTGRERAIQFIRETVDKVSSRST